MAKRDRGCIRTWSFHPSPVAMYYRCALLLALAGLALAHEHHDDLSEEEINAPVDSILWIHIFLQVVVWGFLFPVGMVLGITRSRWHVPLQVRVLIIRNELALTGSECRHCAHNWWLLPRTCTQRPKIQKLYTPTLCFNHVHPDRNASCSWDIPQAAHSRENTAALGCQDTRIRRQELPRLWMGTDAFWCYRI